ncbi:ricin-type beta-trefoil lectin domain protein [Streptomyces sp. NPDC055966]|uniref:ricin-type beta-trefoil lectin domain protein n=1 Tax=Streptomyces sp. NPDC055966 TaxID=3345669 RepID=UPI0035E32851
MTEHASLTLDRREIKPVRHIWKMVSALAIALGLGLTLCSVSAQADPVNPQPYAYGFLAALYKPPSNNGTYFCMDEYRQINGQGRPVVLKPCDGSWNQFWFVDQNGLIHSTNDGQCLWGHVANGPSDGPDTIAVPCNSSDAHQRWTFDSNRSVCNGANACLNSTGMPGPRGSYHLMGAGKGPSPNINQQFDWHHSDSNTPINPNL